MLWYSTQRQPAWHRSPLTPSAAFNEQTIFFIIKSFHCGYGWLRQLHQSTLDSRQTQLEFEGIDQGRAADALACALIAEPAASGSNAKFFLAPGHRGTNFNVNGGGASAAAIVGCSPSEVISSLCVRRRPSTRPAIQRVESSAATQRWGP